MGRLRLHKRHSGVDEPSVTSVSISLAIPVHFAIKGNALDLSQMLGIAEEIDNDR